MKHLNQYIIESTQTYEFKIKIASIEINDEILDRIEHALNAFDLVKLSKVKNLPIKEKNLDFPSFGACEVTLIIATLGYPCNDAQVRQAIGTQGRLPLANIVVIPANQPEELMREDEANEDDTKLDKKAAILTKDIEQVTGGQPQVGQQRADSMLKELESRKTEFASSEKTASATTTNSLPQNNTSPVATKSHRPQGR